MPRHSDQTRLAPRPEIGALLRQLAGDSVRWANAELNLARSELLALRRLCIAAAIFAAGGFAALLTALIILAQVGVGALAGYLGNDIWAGLVVAASFLVLAAICGLAMRRMFKWEVESFIFRWFAPPADQKRSAQ